MIWPDLPDLVRALLACEGISTIKFSSTVVVVSI